MLVHLPGIDLLWPGKCCIRMQNYYSPVASPSQVLTPMKNQVFCESMWSLMFML